MTEHKHHHGEQDSKKTVKKHSKTEKTILTIIFIVLVVGVGAILYRGSGGSSSTDAQVLASCLSDKEIKMFGAEYCGACKYQKEMFGDAFKKVDYTDCVYNEQACRDNNITLYPTWIIEGNQVHGAQPLDKLARISGCVASEE
jgi:hypothetical protein